jgi:hypothetical protein
MLRMCVPCGLMRRAQNEGKFGFKNERQSVKFSDMTEVIGKKCLGTTVTLWLNLEGPLPLTPPPMSL